MAANNIHPNLCANNWGDDDESLTDSQQIIHSKLDDTNKDGELQKSMAIIDVDDLIGCTFQATNERGVSQQKTIIEAIKDHEDNTLNNPEHIKFCVSHNQDHYEELMSYNNVMET